MSAATCGVAVAVEATIASRAEPARRVGEAEVVRPEVVPPLRDAVRLVDDEQADARRAGCARGTRATRSARARRRAAAARRAPRASSAARLAAASCWALTSADAPGRDALERLDLVLHQRDERRDDQRQVRPHQRRELVAERLARAGGHDDEHVAAGERGLHRLALAGAEAGEAEQLAQGASTEERDLL